MNASRSRDLPDGYRIGVVQSGGRAEEALRTLAADAAGSSWGSENEKDIYGLGGGGFGESDKEIDPSGFLFPGFQFHSGPSNATNNHFKCQSFPHEDNFPCVNFTRGIFENPPSSGLQILQYANSPENDISNLYLESDLHPNSRPSPELPSNFVFPVPNNGLCMNFVKTDFLNIKYQNIEWMSNSNSRVFQSCENIELGILQVQTQNHQTFHDTSELEFRCRELPVILCKELTNSDVGNTGRIVLPKREAEAYLPPLSERDGILLQMDDMTLPVTWKFKYRFWPNNRSRMYILEATGDFVRSHCLQAGDSLIIYRNPTSGNYFVRGKKGIPQRKNQFNVDEDCRSSGLAGSDRKRFLVKQNESFEHGSSSLTMTGTSSIRTDGLNDTGRDNPGPHYYP